MIKGRLKTVLRLFQTTFFHALDSGCFLFLLVHGVVESSRQLVGFLGGGFNHGRQTVFDLFHVHIQNFQMVEREHQQVQGFEAVLVESQGISGIHGSHLLFFLFSVKYVGVFGQH